MSDKFLTEEDPLVNNLVNLLKLPKGSITVKTNDTPAFSLEFQGDKVLLDTMMHRFSTLERRVMISIVAKTKTAKELAQVLTRHSNPITFLFSEN